MGKYPCRCSLRLYLGNTVVLNLYQWFSRKLNANLFADYTSLFSAVRDLNTSEMKFMTTWKRLKHQLISGKWTSISILWSRQKKLYTHGKEINPIILILFSTAIQLKKVLTKNIWVYFLIVNLILMNILKEWFIKLVNLSVLFASCEIFYRDHLFYKSLNLLLDTSPRLRWYYLWWGFCRVFSK